MRGMNNKNERIGVVPVVPQGIVPDFIKNKEDRQIFKCESFSYETRLYEVESASGIKSKIHDSKITKEVTEEEKMGFLRSRNKKSN